MNPCAKYWFFLISVISINMLGTDFQDPNNPSQTASNPHLTYYGGPVVSNVKVVSVLWGQQINPQVAQMLPSFLAAIVQSKWLDWQCEYNTYGKPKPTTNQLIGRGKFIAQRVIVPANQNTSLTDQQIQTELAHQLTANNLPAPHYDKNGRAETVYMIQFPPGISISLDGSHSCQSGGFCAYHGAFKYNNKTVLYSVHPSFAQGSGCDVGCGSGSMVQNTQSVYSHELSEAVTDPDVSFAEFYGPPLAWYDPINGENADICRAQGPIVVGGKTYEVQRVWSNSRNACIITNPDLPPAPKISGPATVKQGKFFILRASGGKAPYQWYKNGNLIRVTQEPSVTIKAGNLGAGNYIVRGRCTEFSNAITIHIKA